MEESSCQIAIKMRAFKKEKNGKQAAQFMG
jgi:hypothetical protein